MKKILISIIIPVYNVEDKINHLLDSLCSIKSQDIEIIFVDNNSTDNSLKIIKKYIKKDKRAKYFIETQKGPNAARKLGYLNSSGEYVYFIDSDDYIIPTTFDYIIKNSLKNKPDVIISNYNELNNKYEFIKTMKGFGNNNILLYKPCLWNKIFKKSLLEKNDFNINDIGEDMYITIPILSSTNNIECINKSLYNYVKNDTGLSSKNNYNILINSIKTLSLLKEKLIKRNLYDKNYEEINYILTTHLLYRGFKGVLLSKKEKSIIREKVLSFLKDINYKKNIYYKKSLVYKLVNMMISSKIIYNLYITKFLVCTLFNNKFFNKILLKLDK